MIGLGVLLVLIGCNLVLAASVGYLWQRQRRDRRRRRPLHLGDMPHHPESLHGDLSPREEDAWEAIEARLAGSRVRRAFRRVLRVG